MMIFYFVSSSVEGGDLAAARSLVLRVQEAVVEQHVERAEQEEAFDSRGDCHPEPELRHHHHLKGEEIMGRLTLVGNL